MEKIKITCDSTCDLPVELCLKYDVEVTPLSISLGDEIRTDGVNICPEELFEFVNKNGTLPKTSAVSPAYYTEVFGKYVSQGYSVIHISLSSELSSTYQNACIAASEFEGVHVIDSLNLCTGSGFLAVRARELADEGKSAEEIVGMLNALREKVDASFILQTLEYLRIGGRCSSVAALGANLLKLRPEIIVRDGKMTVGTKFRGSLQKSILDYIRAQLEDRADADLSRIFVMHTGVPEDVLEKAVGLVRELKPFEEVIVGRAGCTISTHCGPECFGIIFMKK